MKGKRYFTAGIICSIVMMFLCACGNSQSESSDTVYVGVTYYNKSDLFMSELITCLRTQFSNLENDGDIEIVATVRDAAGSQRTQNDQVKEMVDSGCNVLCVNLVDRSDPSEIIDFARENDVPIIFFNREPVEEDLMQWDKLYYVGAEAKQSGVMQGELAVEVIQADSSIDRNRDGKIQYVVLEGEPGHQDSIIRTENAVDTLKNNGIELEKLSYQIANWDRSQAQNRMTQLMNQYQSKIELVLANNDAMALGAIDAYEKSNYTESAWPVFFGIDGTEAGLEAVRDSKLAGTVYNDKEGQAEAIAKLAIAAVTVRGMEEFEFENEKYIYLPYIKVASTDVEDFLGEK